MAAWDLWENMGEYGNIAAPSNIMCGRLSDWSDWSDRSDWSGGHCRLPVLYCVCYWRCAFLICTLYTVPQHLADFFAIQQMAVGVAEFAPGDGSGFVK